MRRRQYDVSGLILIFCVDVHMGLDPPPPSTCVHLSLTPSPLRVDVINGWPIKHTDEVDDKVLGNNITSSNPSVREKQPPRSLRLQGIGPLAISTERLTLDREVRNRTGYY